MTLLRKVEEHAARTEDTAVTGRKRCGQHHEIDNSSCAWDTHALEHRNERAALGSNLVPRIDGYDDEQRADVENQDAPEDRIDSTRKRLGRVFRFSGGQSKHFDTAVR